MKTLKILHTADWHADNDPKKQMKLEASLGQIVDYCKANKVNAIVHAGDIWEKKQSYADKSGVPLVITYLRHLSKLVDFIFITKGNNSHDEPGSVSLLHQLEANIYAYEYPVVLGVYDGGFITDLLRSDKNHVGNVEYIVSLVPYPTKASLISEDSIDNNNANFIEVFENIFEHIGEVTQPYTCPKILAFHGNVVGSRLSSGQTLVSQDIMVAPSTLEKANHDYYALGHIHLRQFFKPNMGYSGSIYNKSWGEVEQKSFEIVTFTYATPHNGVHETEQIMLENSRPMITLSGLFEDGIIKIHSHSPSLDPEVDYEFRLRIDVKENDRKLITENRIEELKAAYGDDIKIEFNIIPDERESRSEEIMNCRTLYDEVEEYAKVVEFELNGSIKQKVLSMQSEEVTA